MSKSEKDGIEVKGNVELPTVVDHLQSVVDGLKSGVMRFQQGDRVVTLQPADRVHLKLRAGQKEEKERLSFELSWREHANGHELEIRGDNDLSKTMPADKGARGPGKARTGESSEDGSDRSLRVTSAKPRGKEARRSSPKSSRASSHRRGRTRLSRSTKTRRAAHSRVHAKR